MIWVVELTIPDINKFVLALGHQNWTIWLEGWQQVITRVGGDFDRAKEEFTSSTPIWTRRIYQESPDEWTRQT